MNGKLKLISWIVVVAAVIVIWGFVHQSRTDAIKDKVHEIGGELVSTKTYHFGAAGSPFSWYQVGEDDSIKSFVYTIKGEKHTGWVLFKHALFAKDKWVMDEKK
jgi:hypothetical protein